MKKLFAVIAGLALSTMVASAGPCSTTTTMAALNTLAGGSCDFGGITFSNFFFSGYQDNAFAGSGAYSVPINNTFTNETILVNGANMANYIVNFTQNGTDVSVTVTPGTTNGWLLSVPFAGSIAANFGFELKYSVSPISTPIQSVSGQVSVAVAGSPDLLSIAVLQKALTVPGTITNTVSGSNAVPNGTNNYTATIPGSGIAVGANPQVTDNYFSQLGDLNSAASLNTLSVTNTFSFVPEPMTFGLMGGALVGLALLRRRTAKK